MPVSVNMVRGGAARRIPCPRHRSGSSARGDGACRASTAWSFSRNSHVNRSPVTGLGERGGGPPRSPVSWSRSHRRTGSRFFTSARSDASVAGARRRGLARDKDSNSRLLHWLNPAVAARFAPHRQKTRRIVQIARARVLVRTAESNPHEPKSRILSPLLSYQFRHVRLCNPL